jgi:hypothetical protein
VRGDRPIICAHRAHVPRVVRVVPSQVDKIARANARSVRVPAALQLGSSSCTTARSHTEARLIRTTEGSSAAATVNGWRSIARLTRRNRRTGAGVWTDESGVAKVNDRRPSFSGDRLGC